MTAIFDTYSTQQLPACLPHFASSGNFRRAHHNFGHHSCPAVPWTKPFRKFFHRLLVESADAEADVVPRETRLTPRVPVEHPAREAVRQGAKTIPSPLAAFNFFRPLINHARIARPVPASTAWAEALMARVHQARPPEAPGGGPPPEAGRLRRSLRRRTPGRGPPGEHWCRPGRLDRAARLARWSMAFLRVNSCNGDHQIAFTLCRE